MSMNSAPDPRFALRALLTSVAAQLIGVGAAFLFRPVAAAVARYVADKDWAFPGYAGLAVLVAIASFVSYLVARATRLSRPWKILNALIAPGAAAVVVSDFPQSLLTILLAITLLI